jgi:uncharacterized protein (TIGR02145 family)
MKILRLKSRKMRGGKLVKFLVAFAVLAGGIFGFQYIVNAISITNIVPNTGSVVGGQEVKITGDFTFTPTTLQQITQDYCTNEMSIFPTADSKPDTVTLTDTRNNQEYRIRKLADNKCWMIDNLKFELTDGMKLTPDTTNVKVETTVNLATSGLGVGGNFTTSGYLTADGDGGNVNGTNYDAWRQVNPSDPNMPNSTNCIDNNGAYNADSKTGCGYLYNFYTATAGSAPQTDFDNGKGAGYIAKQSICPAGWKLPNSQNVNDDFGFLDTKYGGTGGYQIGTPAVLDKLWLPTGAWQGAIGGYYYSSLRDQGLHGRYLTSMVYSLNNAYVMYFSSSYVYPSALYSSRFYGFAVRCLVDESHTPAPVVPVVPTVTFGGVAATVVGYSDTSITVVVPEHLAGKVDVIVTRGSESFTLPNAYEYFNVPDVPNTGVSKTSATTTAVQSGLTALIIITIGIVIFVIKQRKARR